MREGSSEKVAGKNKLPLKWADFLFDPTNKQELFEFLSNKVVDFNCPVNKKIVTTSGSTAIIRGSGRSMEPCNHEKADMRLIFHLQDVILNGCHNCLIHTVDTDVIVIVISKFNHLKLCQDNNIQVAFGIDKKFSYYHINAL